MNGSKVQIGRKVQLVHLDRFEVMGRGFKFVRPTVSRNRRQVSNTASQILRNQSKASKILYILCIDVGQIIAKLLIFFFLSTLYFLKERLP